MSKQSSRNQRFVEQAASIAWLAPSVAARRLRMLATQQPHTAAKNLGLMGAEKIAVFAQSWNAMAFAAMQGYTRMAMTMAPWTARSQHAQKNIVGASMQAATSMMAAAMQPIHGRVKRNAGRKTP